MTNPLVARLLAGEAAACARLMTYAERADPRYRQARADFRSRLGQAARIGITGPPGAGKSTLVERLVLAAREQQRKVGVVAVDPSSPFTGGALLGDRVRMAQLALDPGVFIRSMASRGVPGGLARATEDVADVLDAFGCDDVLVETVGVGQGEVDVLRVTDLVLVVLHPGAGDAIQGMKAGLMEVADVFVVNQSDRPGADVFVAQLLEALALRAADDGVEPAPVLSCSALTGEGVPELVEQVDARWRAGRDDGRMAARRAAQRERRVRRLVEASVCEELWEADALGAALARRLDEAPDGCVHELVDELLALWHRRGRNGR